MNQTKKSVIMAASIFALILGGFLFADTLYSMIMAGVEKNIDPVSIPVFAVMFLLSAAMLTLGALICRKAEQKTLLITLLILYVSGIFMIPVFLGDYGYLRFFNGFEIIFSIAGTVLTVIGLCMTDRSVQRPGFPPPPPFPPFPPPPPHAPNMPPPPFPPEMQRAMEREKRIESLKHLRSAGDITEEEYKALLLKELEK